jgi:hypothetical protein
MNRVGSFARSGGLALVVFAALFCFASGQVRADNVAQQFNANSFQAATAEATEYCTALWSDHAFDRLRDKIPLLGEQPTASMLTSTQRLRLEDRPLADLALEAFKKCKAAHARAWAKLPPAANTKVLGVVRQFDDLNAQLYRGEVTFGEYNVKRIQILQQLALATRIGEGSAVEVGRPSVAVKTTSEPPAPFNLGISTSVFGAGNAAFAQVGSVWDTADANAITQQFIDLDKQGRYSEAVPLAQKALALREKALGQITLTFS